MTRSVLTPARRRHHSVSTYEGLPLIIPYYTIQTLQEKVILAWRHRQQEEMFRQNNLVVLQKSEEGKLDRQHSNFKRISNIGRGPWQKR